MKCKQCQLETTNANFCSRRCAVTFNNHAKPKRKAKWKMCSCGAQHRCRTLRCSECVTNDKITSVEHRRLITGKMTLADVAVRYQQRGIAPSYRHGFVRNHCHEINSHLPKRCQVCGYDMHVELCHIKAIASFDLTSTLAEINNENNIVVLCRNHHWELDNHVLMIENVPKR